MTNMVNYGQEWLPESTMTNNECQSATATDNHYWHVATINYNTTS